MMKKLPTIVLALTFFGVVGWLCLSFLGTHSRDGLGEGDMIPSVAFKTPGGATVQTDSLIGKPFFILFSASWCPACTQATRMIKALLSENPIDSIVVLYRDPYISPDKLKAYQSTFTTVFEDTDIASSLKFGVTGLPTMFLVDKTGKIVWMNVGADISATEFRKQVKLIKES